MLGAQGAVCCNYNVVFLQLVRIWVAVLVGLYTHWGVRPLLTFATLRAMVTADLESAESRLVLYLLDPLIHDSAVSETVVSVRVSSSQVNLHLHRCDDSNCAIG